MYSALSERLGGEPFLHLFFALLCGRPWRCGGSHLTCPQWLRVNSVKGGLKFADCLSLGSVSLAKLLTLQKY